MSNTMELNGFTAKIMQAERLRGEQTHELPPGRPLSVYKVDQFTKHPETWMRGDGCYVVPVKSNKGLWFDWTDNDAANTAILPSVKGCNPITGTPTSGFSLEEHNGKCPTHGIEFTGNRYCSECGYSWPTQNYVTAPNTLWWDGFRSEDGSVRQFFFTEESMRDMPSQLIGEENTVPAFGFAFYSPKKRRLNRMAERRMLMSSEPNIMSDMCLYSTHSTNGVEYSSKFVDDTINCQSSPVTYSQSDIPTISKEETIFTYGDSMENLDDVLFGFDSSSDSTSRSRSIQKPVAVSVGAGAKINQSLRPDSYGVNSWKDTPDAVMRIYFVFEDEFNKWKDASGGLSDATGMLSGKIVG
jgi:hypothetical protein